MNKDGVTISRIPTKSRAQVETTKVKKKSSNLSKTVGVKEPKENLMPSCGHELSSSGTLLLPGAGPSRRPAVKSMGYMEMKRQNQELHAENQGFRESLEATELKYQDALNMLALERAEHKKLQSELKSELKHYQECLAARNQDIEALQQCLKEIKFENEQLAAVLEGAKLDAATGVPIQGIGLPCTCMPEMDYEDQHKDLDQFISGLNTTISQLKEQEICIANQMRREH